MPVTTFQYSSIYACSATYIAGLESHGTIGVVSMTGRL